MLAVTVESMTFSDRPRKASSPSFNAPLERRCWRTRGIARRVLGDKPGK
jgi:hypothetical protein